MRLLAAAITLVFLGIAGLSGHALWVMSGLGPAQASSILLASPKETESRVAPARQGNDDRPDVPAPVRFWPALFGEPEPPAPANAAPAPPEAKAPSPPKPPLSSLGFSLKGVVRTDAGVWATVDHPSGNRLLRKGDELAPDVVVARIDSDGVWVSRFGDEPELLAFPEPR